MTFNKTKSSTHATLKVVAAVFTLAFLSGVAHAELKFSYNQNLNNVQVVDGGVIQTTSVYFFWEDETGVAQVTDFNCCNWVSGAGSNERFAVEAVTETSENSFLIDLSDQYPGSTRQVSIHVNGIEKNATFLVGRTPDYQPVQLASSGPIVVATDGQVIENLRFDTDFNTDCAIKIVEKNNVVIRNVEIAHKNTGICIFDSQGTSVSFAKITSSSAPEKGPHCLPGETYCDENNRENRADPDTRISIKLVRSDNTSFEFIDMEKGSSGLYIVRSAYVDIHDLRCIDSRGPYPRGQCVQFNKSDNGVLRNFYVKNYFDISNAEDNINMYDSDNGHVSHGLVDGNYSINGVGVIADLGSHDMVISHVDFIRTTNAAINNWTREDDLVGRNFTADNVRIKDTTCVTSDRGLPPSSGALAIALHPAADNPSISAVYWNHCRSSAVWCVTSDCRRGDGGSFDIREENFQLKDPLQLLFPWQESKPVITDITVR